MPEHGQDHGFLLNLLVLLACSLPLALVLRRLGQSTVVGYLATGLIIGPGGLKLMQGESIHALSEIGVGLLLFTVGIELSIARMWSLKRIAFGGGALQVGATAIAAAAAVGLATGRVYEAVYIGCAVSLSSTAIALKTLADRGDMDAPYTGPVTAVAIFQDVATVPMMVVLPALAAGDTWGQALPAVLVALAKTAALFAVLYLGSVHLVDRLLFLIASARSPEIFVIGVVTMFCGAAYLSQLAGLSLALGAFVAGVLLADSEYAHQILAEVTPFKGVFQAIFFVAVGMLLDPAWVIAHPEIVAATSAAVILGKSVFAAGALVLVGLPARVAAAAGIALGQVGEFSFVLIAVGKAQNLISDDVYQLTLAASFVSMALAPLLIGNVRAIVDALARTPGIGGRLAGGAREDLAEIAAPLRDHVIICGFGPVGRDVAMFLLDHAFEFIVIELNPKTVREFAQKGIPIHFGDFANPVVLEQAGVARAKAVVVTAPDLAASLRAVRLARERAPGVTIVARTKFRNHVEAILNAGANEVIEEEFETALEMVARLVRTLELPRRVVAEHMASQRLERYRLQPGASTGDDRVPGEASVASGELRGAFEIEVVKIGEGSLLAGKTIAEADVRGRSGATVLAIGRGNEHITNPAPSLKLEPGDRVACVGTASQLDALASLAGGK